MYSVRQGSIHTGPSLVTADSPSYQRTMDVAASSLLKINQEWMPLFMNLQLHSFHFYFESANTVLACSISQCWKEETCILNQKLLKDFTFCVSLFFEHLKPYSITLLNTDLFSLKRENSIITSSNQPTINAITGYTFILNLKLLKDLLFTKKMWSLTIV